MSIESFDITVLIPVKGDCPYLSQTIDSVLIQEFPSQWEILLITQDLSRGTKEILKAYASQNLRIVENYNSGLVSSLNLGIQESRYRYIARMDADDLMMPNRIKKQVEFLSANPEVEIVGGQMKIINSEGTQVGTAMYLNSNFLIQWGVRFSSPFSHPSVLYKKSAVKNVGLYDVRFEFAEDYDLWIRMLEQSKGANILDFVTLYRTHDKQVTKEKLQSHLDSVARIQARFFLSRKLKLAYSDLDVFDSKDFANVYSRCRDFYSLLQLMQNHTGRVKFFLLFRMFRLLPSLLFGRALQRFLYLFIGAKMKQSNT